MARYGAGWRSRAGNLEGDLSHGRWAKQEVPLDFGPLAEYLKEHNEVRRMVETIGVKQAVEAVGVKQAVEAVGAERFWAGFPRK